MKKLLIFALILAMFLVISPAPALALSRPEIVSPIGSASGDSITFEWNYDVDADEFRLEVWQEDSLVFKEYLDTSICDDGTADYGITIDIGVASNEINLDESYLYTWKVRAYKDSISSSWSSTEDFWYELVSGYPAIMISPASGDIGTSVTIRGFDWQDGEDIEIFVDRDKVKTLRNVDIDWHTHITINDIGSQSIRVKGEDSGWSNFAWFLVEGPDVEIRSDSSGQVGSIIKVSGDNWPDEAIGITFGSRYITSVVSRGGDWSVSFVCPELPAGEWPITAYSRHASAETYFEIEPSLLLSPESTGPAEPVMAKGYGFAASSSIRIALNTATFYSTTNFNGIFSKEIRAPSESGSFIVEARDSKGNIGTAELSIGGILNVSPPVLFIGSPLTIRGSSFGENRNVEITCDGQNLAETETDNFGNFSIAVKPELKFGKHIITASDGQVSASATFEVESQAPSIPNPLQPYNDKTLFGRKVTLAWASSYDPSGVTYEARVASDDLFRDIIGLVTVSSPRASIVVPSDDTYYWQVRAIDGAGNTSNWSSSNSFSVNQTWGIVIWVVVAGLFAALGISAYFWFRRKK